MPDRLAPAEPPTTADLLHFLAADWLRAARGHFDFKLVSVSRGRDIPIQGSTREPLLMRPVDSGQTMSLIIQRVSTSVALQVSHQTRAMCSGNIE